MAFVQEFKDHRDRFSLLMLDPGEIYFEDFSVNLIPTDVSPPETEERKSRGRLKVCSKSLVFDPQDTSQPLIKFPFQRCDKIIEHEQALIARQTTNAIAIHCKQIVEMKADNMISPFKFKQNRTNFIFELNYCKSEDFLATACQLLRASTLPTLDHDSMIAAIVFSRQNRVPFDTSRLDNLFEKIVLETTAERIMPLVVNPGRILLTSDRLYFQPFNNVENVPVMKFKLTDIKFILKRRFLQQHVGIEIYCSEASHRSDLYLALASEEERDKLYDDLISQESVRVVDTGQENMTYRWQTGQVSNFDYLMFLNSEADRSFNDLTQYPVMPWILADYCSTNLDLEEPLTYRDLSKPIGALSPERLQRFKDRYKEMPAPKFLYGSHYSTPGFVLYYLLRKAPEHALCLQNGKFDQPDRLFRSVKETWDNVLDLPSDVKELIPEFYMPEMADFLENRDNLQLGTRQDGSKVNDVDLPLWAEDTVDFCRKLRQAMESEHVSRNLHHWIDLIFGYKQKGEEAEKADNVFYYLTYEGAIDLKNISNPEERASFRAQIMEFGQIPKQIFQKPHPVRFEKPEPEQTAAESIINSENTTTENGLYETSNGSVEEKSCHVISDDSQTPSSKQSFREVIDRLAAQHSYKLHKDAVTALRISTDQKIIYSVSKDAHLKLYSMEDKHQLRSINICNMPLSSLAAMPDGNFVLVASWDNSLHLYSVDFGRVVDTIPAHDDAIAQLCWHNTEAALLATASWDSSVKVWSCSRTIDDRKKVDACCIAELEHETGVTCLDLTSDQASLVSGTKDGSVYFWDIQSQTVHRHSHSHVGNVNTVKFSPDDKLVASAGEDGYLRVVDIQTGTEVFAKNTSQPLRCLAWVNDFLFVGDARGVVSVWDMVKVEPIASLQDHDNAVCSLEICQTSATVVCGHDDGKTVIWKPR
ncbi:protein FAN-like [Apostichopus japonicus]|uniref:protein FAN-like n=1 Tax=Stichopus japonicus TaxID=307972 RepID=UPI003AB752D4